MSIVHIERPADLDPSAFAVFMPPPVGELPRSTIGSVEAWAAADGSVETGTWEATPGTFARAIVDAEFCHFVRGHATFVTDDGRRFEFKAGDAAYFPPPYAWHVDDSRDAAQDVLHLALTQRGVIDRSRPRPLGWSSCRRIGSAQRHATEFRVSVRVALFQCPAIA